MASDSDSNGTSGFGHFNDTASATTSDQIVTPLAEADAFQNSIVQLAGSNFTGAEGQGTAETNVVASSNDSASANASTSFLIRFSIPAGESYNYTLSGDLGTNGSGATAQVYLDRILPTMEEQFFRAGNAGAYSTNGTLGPGTYELSASAGALGSEVLTGNPDANFSVDLALTPVPEPAALALITLPAAALLARRRRQ